jgi:hypothetical protein
MSQIPLSQIPMSQIPISQIPMSLILRVAVTGAGHLGSRPTDKQTDVCTSSPAMNAISPLVSSSRHYKIAGEFLEAGIDYLREKYLHQKYLREIHPRDTSVIEMMGATTDLPATDIILHLIDNPVDRLVFKVKFPLDNKVNRANIDNQRLDDENHRFTNPNASLNPNDPSLEYQSGLPIFMRCGQHQPVQRLNAAIRDCA